MVAAAGCNHDGRSLRPARPDQNVTISTTAAPTTVLPPDFGTASDGSVGAGVTPSASESGVPLEGVTVVAPWRDGAPIDARFTCSGDNVSPPLSWSAVPAGTTEIAITMTDQQAPSFVHWAVAGIDPTVTSIGEGELPTGAVQATNGNGATGYTGPCPPAPESHTYVITVHFLDSQTELGDGAAGTDMMLAIEAATFDSAQVTGTFST